MSPDPTRLVVLSYALKFERVIAGSSNVLSLILYDGIIELMRSTSTISGAAGTTIVLRSPDNSTSSPAVPIVLTDHSNLNFKLGLNTGIGTFRIFSDITSNFYVYSL